MRAWMLCCLCMLAAPVLAAPPASGLYFDSTRNGHGVDLQIVGDHVVGALFTYETDGQPFWYLIDGQWSGAVGTVELVEYRYSGSGASVAQRFAGARIERVATAAQCGDGSARPGALELYDFQFSLAGENLRWCLQAIVPGGDAVETALSGSWYAGEADSGWGLISYLFGAAGAAQSFHTLYVYDGAGRPRWAFASEAVPDTDFAPNFTFARGYCRSCASVALDTRSAGPAQIRLITPRNDVDSNRISYALTYPFGGGGSFTRSERPLRVLTQSSTPPGVVATREGLVRGTLETPGQMRFPGIPFAAPPVGALRWRAPQFAPARTQPRDGGSFGPACSQSVTSEGVFATDLVAIDEDCLHLNIWSPEVRAGANRPVMVWIHGGGLTQGASGERRMDGGLQYEGARLADDGVVVVTINYRLGPFGYMALRELGGEFPDHPSAGNYGLLDQIAALRWVQSNIRGFGGDPDRVTIFGESAGAVSTCALVASPLARGLFHRAIMESGGCQRSLPALNSASVGSESAYTQGDRIIGLAGCSNAPNRVTCMRALSAEQLVEVARPTLGFGREGEDFGLVIDQYALTEGPGSAIANGRAATVPLIVGINADEMTTLLPASARPPTVAAYEALIASTFPQLTPQVLALYPTANYPAPWYAYADIIDDLTFACPARAYSRNHAAAGNPVWRYVYTHVFDNASAIYGAFHGADIAFVFGPYPFATAAEIDLSAQIQRQWTRFAASGNPNGGSDPIWPQRTPSDDVSIEFDDVRRGLISNYRRTQCDFWERYVLF